MKHIKKIGLTLLSGVCAITAALGLAACGGDEIVTGEGGSSTTLITNKAPDELTPENAVYAFLQKQSEFSSYKITAEGTAVASLAGYKQDIHNITFKNGEDYLNQASSDSFLVKMKHQSFSKNGKVVYRDNFDGDMQVAEKAEYKKVYGFTADDIVLGGYIINAKTLRYVTLEKTEGDTFTYYMRLAGDQSVESGSATESATTCIRLQSKAYGSLDNLPSYSDVDMRLTIKRDWTPVSYVSSCSYDAKKLFNMTVEQQIVSTYSDVNGQVEIPDVEAFNQMLGTAPSVVTPAQNGSDALTQLTTALGNTVDENGVLALPLTIGVETKGTTAALNGDLTLKIQEGAMESGALLDAFTARLDIDLTKLPLVSRIANTLTVRYPGDGVLLVALNNRTEGRDNYLFTYTADLGGALGTANFDGVADGGLQSAPGEYLALEKTATGFTIALKNAAVAKLNEAFGGVLETLETKLGAAKGALSSLGISFEGVTATLAGTEKITGIALLLNTTCTAGETLGVSLDVNMFSSREMLGGAFEGDLQLRLNPAALLTGDYYAIAEAQLHLDLKPAAPVLQMVGTFAPAGSLPPFVGPALDNLDLYYAGDGVLTLALNNKENQPLFVTQIDLKTVQMPALPDHAAASLLSEFRIEKTADGLIFALGDHIVQNVNEAYQKLIQTAANFITQSAGTMAGRLVTNMISATITDLEFLLGRNDDGKVMFGFMIKGFPQFDQNHDYSERPLLTFTLTDRASLTPEQQTALSASKKTADALLAQNEKDNKAADAFANKLQPYIESVVLTEQYIQNIQAVDALKEEFDALSANVQTLVSNAAYMADTQYNGETYSKLHVIYSLYRARVDDFIKLLPKGDDYTNFTGWDALNALYDKSEIISGITVPAVKDSDEMKAAIGESRIKAYENGRYEYESSVATKLKGDIAAAKTKFDNAKTRDDWTAALTEIEKTFKPVYDKLPAKLQENTGYQEFVKQVYMKNIEELTNAYEEITKKLTNLLPEDQPTIDGLLKVMKKLASASVWGSSYDFWTSNSGPKIALRWINNLKPTDLTEEEQGKVSALTETRDSFMTGEKATKIATTFMGIIQQAVQELYKQIGGCRKVVDGTETWDFAGLNGTADTVLEKIHGLRFLLKRVLSSADADAIFEGDDNLKKFALTDLITYETKLAAYIAEQPGAKG